MLSQARQGKDLSRERNDARFALDRNDGHDESSDIIGRKTGYSKESGVPCYPFVGRHRIRFPTMVFHPATMYESTFPAPRMLVTSYLSVAE